PAAIRDSGPGLTPGRIQSAWVEVLPLASNSRYSYRGGRKEKNESRMVFENLKAAFLQHLTHTSFISRKVGFSRRCLMSCGEAAYLDPDRRPQAFPRRSRLLRCLQYARSCGDSPPR